MATRSARDNKALNARHAETLKAMLRLPENKTCADCKRNDPRWASTNLGCFMCIRCSGIHRSMGVHITRIKSIDLDTWTPEQVSNVQRWGNRRANAYWEAHLRPGHMPPDHKIESFIRSKYESKRWVMSGPMPEPESLDTENDEVAVSPTVPTPSEAPRRPSATLGKAPAAPPATTTISLLDAPPSSNSGISKPTSNAINPLMTTKAPAEAPSTNTNNGGGLFDLDFSPNASASAATATAPAARKDVKNDILSLFAAKSPTTNFQQTSINQSSAFGDLNGLNNQFGNMNVASGLSQPWSQSGNMGNTNHLQQSNQISSSNGFGMMNHNQTSSTLNQNTTSNSNLFDNISDPWSSNNQSNANDGFGNFSVATKSSTSNGKDAFSDIWN